MKTVLCILTGLFFFGCTVDEDLGGDLYVIYADTYCANPWDSQEDNIQLVSNVVNFLKKKNIQVYDITIDQEGEMQLCNACHCLSGRRIAVKIDAKDLNTLKKFAFKEIN